MAYKIVVSLKAQIEIEKAFEYYAFNSSIAPQRFINMLKLSYDILAINPFLNIRYKNIRALKIRKFPYSLYFIVDEIQYTVKVLACFQNKKNPNKRPNFL